MSRTPSTATSDGPMSFSSIALLVAVIALVGYLLASLIFPERF